MMMMALHLVAMIMTNLEQRPILLLLMMARHPLTNGAQRPVQKLPTGHPVTNGAQIPILLLPMMAGHRMTNGEQRLILKIPMMAGHPVIN